LNSGSAISATKSSNDDDLSPLKKRLETSFSNISPNSVPAWTFEEIQKIYKPFEEKEPSEFDKDMAVVRFELLESMKMPDPKNDPQQEYLDKLSDKISDFQQNYADTDAHDDDGDAEVTFKRFLQYAGPLIEKGDYTQWKHDDLDKFIKFWTGRNAVDAVGNLDSAIIIEDFLHGEWEKFLQNHPTLRAIMRPFYLFADWSRDTEEDGEDGADITPAEEQSAPNTSDESGAKDDDTNNKEQQAGNAVPDLDQWNQALESYPGGELKMKRPKELEGTNFCFSFTGNNAGRRKAAHFITFMKQRVSGVRFWMTHSPAVVRV